MNRTTSTLLSLGVSAVLIAVGVWFLYNHSIGFWSGNYHWGMGHHGMMRGGGMGIIMIIFWVVFIAAIALLISGLVTGVRDSKQHENKSPTALEILNTRYTQGKINKTEYEEIRKVLGV